MAGVAPTNQAIPMMLPHGRTARRIGWVHLPPYIRRAVEQRLGTTVVDSFSCDAGFTPGLASVLLCTDGTRHFIKAASVKAQPYSAKAYREEARKARTLPPGLAAPRLRWTIEDPEWVVLGFEYVEGRAPERPWTASDLAAASQMLVDTSVRLTPAPGLGVTDIAEECADWPLYWDHVRRTRPNLVGLDEGARLAAGFAEVATGDTLVHFDVRDDNLIMRPDGRVVLCDWNWPVRGAAWLDSLILLIGPRGDGLDVEAHIAAHPLLAAVDPEAIDRVLALLAGFFLRSGDQPRVSNSPWLREVAAWQGEVCWEWLAQRRSWI